MRRRCVPTRENPLATRIQVLTIDPQLYLIDPKQLPSRTPRERWFREFVQHLQASASSAAASGAGFSGSTPKK